MKAIEKISQELFDDLRNPFVQNLSMGDAESLAVTEPEDARKFAFNFTIGKIVLGTVQITLNSNDQSLEVMFDHDILDKIEKTETPEAQARAKRVWFRFLRRMRKFATTNNLMTFNINNDTQDHMNKKDAEMYSVDELKEGKMSKLAGSTKSSYQRVGENRIIIRHVGPIDEEKMGSRTRNIKAIYIENASGERFLVKENSLIGARILAHHMSAGGNLMDDFSNHLYTMIREMRDLKSFVLGSRNKVFESDDANQMVSAATEYYKALRETVRSLSTGRGYARYLESFDPKIDETNIDAEALKEKFVIRTFNEKFEAALPHIAKAYQKKILEQNALYGSAQNYIDGETKFGLTESDVELYKSMKFESGQALSKKVLEHIASLLQGTDSKLSEFALHSAEKFSTITEAPESQTWLHQELAMNLVKGFVAEMNNLNEKPLNPYAIGMAQAMKSTGDEPPLKKSTIKKAHHIADVINKEQGVAEADISGATMKMIQVGDIVMYLDQKAEVVAISKDRKRARITIEKGMGSVTQDVNISDLNQLGQGVAEDLDEAVGDNYLYHATMPAGLMRILRTGAIKATDRPQPSTKARTQYPTISTTRSKQYAESNDFVDFLNLTNHGNAVILVFDRNAVANHYKMFGTSQGTQTVGDEFEEVIVAPRGSMPIRGTLKGFYFNPKRTAEIQEYQDIPWFQELLTSPYYMGQKQGVAEGAPELLKKEMPLHRHAEKLLAQNGVSKDDPDYHHHLGNTIKHLRQFGNIDLINKSDEQGVAEAQQVEEMDKSQDPPGRDGGHQFPPGPKVSKKVIKAVEKDPAKHLQDLFAKEYSKKKVKEQGVTEGSTTRGGFGGSASQAYHEIEWLKKKIASLPPTKEKQIRDLQRQIRERELAIAFQKEGVAEGSGNWYYIVNSDTNKNIDGPFDTREEAETVYDRMIKRVESGSMEKDFKIQKKEGVAEGLDNKELYGLKLGDVVKARVDDSIVQGNVIDLFPETMEVELLLRGDMAGRTVTVDVRDTEYMDESGVAEERKVTKNEKGDVTGWSDETPWQKANPNKQKSGKAANLAGKALKQTQKMADEEPKISESKATINDKMFTDTLAMLKKYSGI